MTTSTRPSESYAMKVVPDSMLWLSYATHQDGPRHAALNRCIRQRVRLLTSTYIIGEVQRILADKFAKPQRFCPPRIAENLADGNGGEAPCGNSPLRCR